QSSLPVLGSKPLRNPVFSSGAFFASRDIASSSCSWPSTLASSGVLQEPCFSSCSQTVAPVFLSTASRKLRPLPSFGPHQRITVSPYSTGEEPLPKACSHLPRSSRFQSTLPFRS